MTFRLKKDTIFGNYIQNPQQIALKRGSEVEMVLNFKNRHNLRTINDINNFSGRWALFKGDKGVATINLSDIEVSE